MNDRLGLAVEESRAYWEAADPALGEPPALGFERRCLAARNVERIRTILGAMAQRYDAYPEALAVLARWRRMDVATRRVICHWHLQLADPLYRRFSGEFLVERRASGDRIDRPATARWLRQEDAEEERAVDLLTAAAQAGLITARRDPRILLDPEVPDRALGYVLYLLRSLGAEPVSFDDPYLASVGLTEDDLARRRPGRLGVRLRRAGAGSAGVGGLGGVGLDFDHPSLTAWAAATS
jgi:hypothetical protein